MNQRTADEVARIAENVLDLDGGPSTTSANSASSPIAARAGASAARPSPEPLRVVALLFPVPPSLTWCVPGNERREAEIEM